MSARPGEAEAAEAAAEAIYPGCRSDAGKHATRQMVAPVVTAAYPLIARAVAEDIAQQIERHGARRKGDSRICGLMHVEFAASLARNYITKEDQ